MLTVPYCVFYLQFAGLGVLCIGIWMHFDRTTFMYLHIMRGTEYTDLVDKMPYILVGIGCSVTVISFLGCCGACSESICFLVVVSSAPEHIVTIPTISATISITADTWRVKFL